MFFMEANNKAYACDLIFLTKRRRRNKKREVQTSPKHQYTPNHFFFFPRQMRDRGGRWGESKKELPWKLIMYQIKGGDCGTSAIKWDFC